MLTSRRNPRILQLAALATRKGRSASGLTLAEGPHLVRDALDAQHSRNEPKTGSRPPNTHTATNHANPPPADTQPIPPDPVDDTRIGMPSPGAGFLLHEVILAEDASQECLQLADTARERGIPVLSVNRSCYEKISPLRSPEGIAAVIGLPRVNPDALTGTNARLLLLCGVQDPGNLGALVRVAEAAGASGCLCVGGADPGHPKALRASMGSLLRLPCPSLENGEDALALLETAGIRLVATTLTRDAVPYTKGHFSPPLALALGGEGQGLPEALVERAAQRIHIPMAGRVESLNVAVAAGIVLYEAARHWIPVTNATSPARS